MDFQEHMERVRKWTDKLEAGITDLFQSDQYAAYLRAISKLHQYSYGNILLIKLQCPHFSMVEAMGTGSENTAAMSKRARPESPSWPPAPTGHGRWWKR